MKGHFSEAEMKKAVLDEAARTLARQRQEARGIGL